MVVSSSLYSQSLPEIVNTNVTACFNVCTGDIEDAPAVDSIHSFVTEVKDGQIYVTANEKNTLKENMARPPALSSIIISEDASESVVIVGGGAGTMHAIESLRIVSWWMRARTWMV